MKQTKFLLVDDNPIDLMVHKMLLQYAFQNCKVTSFNSPAEAVKFFFDHRANSEELPEVVLLDIIMPQFDGFEFIDELVKIFGIIPFKIFLLSSTLDDTDFTKAKDSKWVQTILNKPLDTEVLKALLEKQKEFEI